MKALLINLDRSPDRYAFSTDWLNKLGIQFERVSAVDGKQMSQDAIERFRKERPLCSWDAGQIGCFLSHIKAMEIAANSSDNYTAVFEDDMHVSPDLKDFLKNEDWIPKTADLIKLETTSERVGFALNSSKFKGRKVGNLRGRTVYAGAYIIKKEYAAASLKTPQYEQIVLDWWLFYSKSRPRIAQVSPALCVQDKQINNPIGFGSNTENIPYRHPPKWKRALPVLWQILKGYRLVRFQE